MAAQTLSHAGMDFKGTYSDPTIGPVELQAFRTKFVGVDNVSEIVAGRGSRMIEFDMWIHGAFDNVSDLFRELQRMDFHVGKNGNLTYDAALGGRVYLPDVTFDSWRTLWGPRDDVAGTVDGGWVIGVWLTFTQLSASIE